MLGFQKPTRPLACRRRAGQETRHVPSPRPPMRTGCRSFGRRRAALDNSGMDGYAVRCADVAPPASACR